MVDALVVSSQSDGAFWLLLAGVGLIALLIILKHVLRGRRDPPRRKSSE